MTPEHPGDARIKKSRGTEIGWERFRVMHDPPRRCAMAHFRSTLNVFLPQDLITSCNHVVPPRFALQGSKSIPVKVSRMATRKTITLKSMGVIIPPFQTRG